MMKKWLKVNQYKEENKEKISRIIQIEWEITDAVRSGHRPHMGDEFKDKRNEIRRLREELQITKTKSNS